MVIGYFSAAKTNAITEPSAPTEKVIKKSIAVKCDEWIYFFDLWMDDEGLVTCLDKGIGLKGEYLKDYILDEIPLAINPSGEEILLDDAIDPDTLLGDKPLSAEEKAEIMEDIENVIRWIRENSYQLLESTQTIYPNIPGVNASVEIACLQRENEPVPIQLLGDTVTSTPIHCEIWIGFWQWGWVNITIWGIEIDIPIGLPWIWIYNCTWEPRNSQAISYTLSYDIDGTLQSADAWYVSPQSQESATGNTI